jgi:LmbE family N-acetylglucosaminyl deacetylase
MAWFLNYYTCDRCGSTWTDEWSCTCDDDCPHCGARHMSPEESDELTEIIEERSGKFVVLWSPETAEHHPDYVELGTFSTRAQAEDFPVSDLKADGPACRD